MKARKVLAATVAFMALFATQTLAFGSTKLTVYNPSASIEIKNELAPRLADLNGKKVAVWLSGHEYGTGKADVLFATLAQEIKSKYPQAIIIPHTQLPIKYDPHEEVTKAILDAKPDAVVVGAGG
jgi:UDP-N-acetyl-D-mannosaminuronic acid transferase (WecB/TagA/CpsF family)